MMTFANACFNADTYVNKIAKEYCMTNHEDVISTSESDMYTKWHHRLETASLIGCVIFITNETDVKSVDRLHTVETQMCEFLKDRTVCYVQNTNLTNIRSRFACGVGPMKDYKKDPLSQTIHTCCYHSHVIAMIAAYVYMTKNPGKYAVILEDDTMFDYEAHLPQFEKCLTTAVYHKYDILKVSQSTVKFDVYGFQDTRSPNHVEGSLYDAPNYMGTFAYVAITPLTLAQMLLTVANDAYVAKNAAEDGNKSVCASEWRYYPVDLQLAVLALKDRFTKFPDFIMKLPIIKIGTYEQQICKTHEYSTILGKTVNYTAALAYGHNWGTVHTEL